MWHPGSLGCLPNIMTCHLCDITLNTSRLRENGCRFADDIFRFDFWWEYHWNLLPKIQLMKSHHPWFRWRFGTEQATNHHLNQWWSSLLMHIWLTWPRLVKNWFLKLCLKASLILSRKWTGERELRHVFCIVTMTKGRKLSVFLCMVLCCSL